MRTELVLQIGLGGTLQDHGCGKFLAIHFLSRWGKNQMGTGFGQLNSAQNVNNAGTGPPGTPTLQRLTLVE